MSERPAASLVIPLLNQRDSWLEQCLLSALRQTVPADVLVVCSPKTCTANLALLRELQRQFPRLQTCFQPGDGLANAANQGFRGALCGRIGMLLSDDWLRPDAVEKCLAYDADIVSTGLTCFSANGIDEFESLSSVPCRPVYDSLGTLEEKAFYLTYFFLFRAAKIEEVGGIDESLGFAPGVDDYDFIWTLLEHDASLSLIGEPLYCYRDHSEERLTLRPPEEQVQGLLRILDKHNVPPAEQDPVIHRHSRWFGKPMHLAGREES